MGQRNVLCTHLLDPKSEQNLHPSHLTYLSNTTNQNIYPTQSIAGNTVAPPLNQFPDHHGGNFHYGNQYDSIQYYHPFSNAALGGTAPSNTYDPYMLASSSIRNVSSQMNSLPADYLPSTVNVQATGVVTSDYGLINSLRRNSERKNAEVVPENFYFVNGPASSNPSSAGSSASSEQVQLEESYKYCPYFTQPEYQGTGIYPMTEGSDIISRSGSSSINFQPVPTLLNDNNYLFQGNLINPSSQPSSIACLEQLENHLPNGVSPNWNYTNGMSHVIGRSINSVPEETVNRGLQEYQHISSNRNPVFISLNHPPNPNPYQHIPPVQGIQVSGYVHHSQITAPFSYPLRYWHSNNTYPSRDGIDSISTFANSFPSMDGLINMPSLYVSPPEIARGNFRVLSEDAAAAALQFSQFEGFEETIDQHRDMRLDIEGMSYEELLALEERIGDVNTGLLEESIMKNLKTSVRASQSTSLQSDHSLPKIRSESEACIICQVDYEENEVIGTLNCGHCYHVECIKQWLLVKNICPICKRSALADDRNER